MTFLDDRLLGGATSNAAERGNRRYRKMKKSIYRVRTYVAIVARLAPDLFREAARHHARLRFLSSSPREQAHNYDR